MLDFTQDLGWFGFFVRLLPSLFIGAVAATAHLMLSRKVVKGSPNAGFLSIFAPDEDYLEGGSEARMWTAGLYAATVVALALTMILGGVPVGEADKGIDTEQRSLDGFKAQQRPRAKELKTLDALPAEGKPKKAKSAEE